MRPKQVPEETRQIAVQDVGEALDFYLSLGYEVCSVADGWVLLRAGNSQLVLVESATSPQDPGRGTHGELTPN